MLIVLSSGFPCKKTGLFERLITAYLALFGAHISRLMLPDGYTQQATRKESNPTTQLTAHLLSPLSCKRSKTKGTKHHKTDCEKYWRFELWIRYIGVVRLQPATPVTDWLRRLADVVNEWILVGYCLYLRPAGLRSMLAPAGLSSTLVRRPYVAISEEIEIAVLLRNFYIRSTDERWWEVLRPYLDLWHGGRRGWGWRKGVAVPTDRLHF